MEPLTLLIDMDFFLYRAATAAEQEHEYSPDLTIIVGDFLQAQKIVHKELKNLRERFNTSKVLLTFTDKENFRKEIDPTYKGHRIKRKPAGFLKLKKWAMSAFPSMIKQGLEADDVMGILATNGKLENFILISPDKDMEQIPCRIYNLKEEFTQTPEEATLKLWTQTLTGDMTDGYKGCVGIGPKKAGLILQDADNPWQAIVETYEKAGQTAEEALTNLRLAKILQSSDWDTAKQQPILYTPL